MSQDTGAGAQQNANQEIDIDELEVDILIVAKNPNNLKQTCAFLSRRGWPTTALGNIQKAIEEIADKKPDVVMISLNHPSPAVLKLPDIIAQSFNLICVGFVETNDASSAGKLASIKLRHKIHGSPSGPNFHRGLRKILAEKFNIKIDEKTGERVSAKSDRGDDKTVISSSEKANDRTVISGKKDQRGPVVISGKNEDGGRHNGSGGPAYMPDHSQSGQADGKADKSGAFIHEGSDSQGHAVKTGSLASRQSSGSLFDDDNTENENSENRNNENKVSVTLTKGEGDPASSGAGVSDKQNEKGGVGSVIEMGRNFKKTGDRTAGTGKRKKLKEMTGSAANGGGNMLFGENLDPAKPASEQEMTSETGAEASSSSSTKADGNKRSMKDAMDALEAAEAEAKATSASDEAKAEGGGATAAAEGTDAEAPGEADLAAVADGTLAAQTSAEGAPNAQGASGNAFFTPPADANTPQDVIEQAVAQAMSEIFRPGSDQQNSNLIALTTVRRIGVFPIDSMSVPGYLVIALEAGSAEDHSLFLKHCEGGLRANLQKVGVTGVLESGFWLDIPEVSFEQWTTAAGRFRFKMNHQGREVGVSFFQTAKPIAKAQLSEHKEMYTISLADISTDEPVTFKAYLHLKENNKFYLYLRDGRQLQPEQKQRLTTSGLASVFMKDEDLDNFRVFLAAAYLKETIRACGSQQAA